MINQLKLTCKDYFTLCKPKVVFLMLVTAWVGMQLASSSYIPIKPLIFGTIGIGFAASAGAVINHLIERHIDIKMRRTETRPIASGRIHPNNASLFAACLAIIGFWVLAKFVNTTTAILTFITFFVYAFFYTIFLKRNTPQNIVIGGIAGAAPPLLGWACISGDVSPNGLLLVLIIFTWTPPHFWALALHRLDDYKKTDMPMLPVTHGIKVTKICILLYTILLFPVTLLPYLVNMANGIYLVSSTILNIMFLYYSTLLYLDKKKNIYIRTFNFSIFYLLLLFLSLLVDHFYPIKLIYY